MDIRDLINELVDQSMNDDIEIKLNLNDETQENSFEVTEARIEPNKVYLEADFSDKVLVDKDKYERMENRLDELEG